MYLDKWFCSMTIDEDDEDLMGSYQTPSNKVDIDFMLQFNFMNEPLLKMIIVNWGGTVQWLNRLYAC